MFFSKKNKIKFSFFKDLEKIYKHNSFFYYLFFIVILFLSIFYTLILANPNTKESKEEVIKNWVDIVLAFDISYSMEAPDLKPNRIEVAKNVISSFLWNLKSDRVWLVVFAWKPFISIPLTYDYKFIQEYLKTIKTSTINQNNIRLQWTAIWDAVLMWSNLFDKDSTNREKVMILLTDWEANKGLTPTIALKYLKEKNIKTYTIWVWSQEKSYIDSNDIFWNKVKLEIPWVDEEILKKIANETNWKYYRASSNQIFSQIFEDIDKLEKKEIKTEIKKLYDTKYDFFYYSLLILNFVLLFLVFKRIRI